MARHCCECNTTEGKLRDIIRHVDGTISRICRGCWDLYDYARVLGKEW
jgi:hypothetical protein